MDATESFKAAINSIAKCKDAVTVLPQLRNPQLAFIESF